VVRIDALLNITPCRAIHSLKTNANVACSVRASLPTPPAFALVVPAQLAPTNHQQQRQNTTKIIKKPLDGISKLQNHSRKNSSGSSRQLNDGDFVIVLRLLNVEIPDNPTAIMRNSIRARQSIPAVH